MSLWQPFGYQVYTIWISEVRLADQGSRNPCSYIGLPFSINIGNTPLKPFLIKTMLVDLHQMSQPLITARNKLTGRDVQMRLLEAVCKGIHSGVYFLVLGRQEQQKTVYRASDRYLF